MHLAGFCDHTVIAAFGEATLGEGKQKPQPGIITYGAQSAHMEGEFH